MSPRRIRGSRSWQRAVRCLMYNLSLLLFWSSSRRDWMIWGENNEESQGQSETRRSSLFVPPKAKSQSETRALVTTNCPLCPHTCTSRSHTHPSPCWEPRGGHWHVHQREIGFRIQVGTKHRTGLFLQRWHSCYRKTAVPSQLLIHLFTGSYKNPRYWVPKAGLEGKKDYSDQTPPSPWLFLPTQLWELKEYLVHPLSLPSSSGVLLTHCTPCSVVTTIHWEAAFLAFLWMIPLSTW